MPTMPFDGQSMEKYLMWTQRQKICVGDTLTLTLTGDTVSAEAAKGWHCTGVLNDDVPIHVVVSGIFTESHPGNWLLAYVVNHHDELIDPQGMPHERVLVVRPIAPTSDTYY